MTNQEKTALYTVLLRLIDDGNELTAPERRELLNTVTHACCGMTADDVIAAAAATNRKLRVKRGTTAQNNAYTGLAGEITMDTSTNTLRIHDGETQGGHTVAAGASLPENIDYVIAWQSPTAENNYTWYRKYKKGWVEQGGTLINNTAQITLPIAMSNNKYCISTNISQSAPQRYAISLQTYNKTTTGFSCYTSWTSSGTSSGHEQWATGTSWTICGCYSE